MFGISKPLLFLRLNERVGAIPTYKVYQLYDKVCDGTFDLPTQGDKNPYNWWGAIPISDVKGSIFQDGANMLIILNI